MRGSVCVFGGLSKLRAKVKGESAYLTAGQDNDLSLYLCLRSCVVSPHRDLEDCITVTVLRHMTVSTKETLITSPTCIPITPF